MILSRNNYPATNGSSRELLDKRAEIVGNIDVAIATLPAHRSVRIEHFGVTDDGQNFGLEVDHIYTSSRSPSPTAADRNGSHVLKVTGIMETQDNAPPDTFPMYRVVRNVPATDSGHLRPHYDISVADPTTPDGYRPVALVMQSILGDPNEPKVSGSPRIGSYYEFFQSSVEQLSAAEQVELKDTGLYLNVSEHGRLAEIHTIMGLMVTHAEVSPAQAALPIDFSTAA